MAILIRQRSHLEFPRYPLGAMRLGIALILSLHTFPTSADEKPKITSSPLAAVHRAPSGERRGGHGHNQYLVLAGESPLKATVHARDWRMNTRSNSSLRSRTIYKGAILAALAPAADRTEVATAALQFGGSLGKLLWVAEQSQANINQANGTPYTDLAYKVKQQIDLGRASSSLIGANFDVVGTALAYTAVGDPEPLSKAITGVAAWGAKKTGDALGEYFLGQAQQQAETILAQGLKNSGLSEADLEKMTPNELRDKVADLQIGGQSLRDILKDDPQSLSMLQANATDIATNIGVAALAKADGTAADVKAVQQQLAETNKNLSAFEDSVQSRLDTMQSSVADLEDATTDANAKLDSLNAKVQGQAKAMQTMADIAYSGWTTGQKLQAVQSGLFPELTPAQTAALTDSLKADQAREEAVADVKTAAQDFGNLATIAKNIGLPSNLVTGLQGAQIAATGIAQFASGDVLGGLSSVTSLFGLGGPDPEEIRYQAMMGYLSQNFAAINAQLNTVINLQVQTLQAIAQLASDELQFRKDVLAQLDVIENDVLHADRLVQAVLINEWQKCYAFDGLLNGQIAIPTRDVLTGIIGDTNITDYAGSCYAQMSSFLDGYVKPANWSGQVIDAGSFPNTSIANDPALQNAWIAFQAQRNAAYDSARDFLLLLLPDANTSPTPYLARLAQPVVNTAYARQLDSLMASDAVHNRFKGFQCNQTDVLSAGLVDLLCYQVAPGSANPPMATRWKELFGPSAPLIGPYSNELIDTGIALANIVDFAQTNNLQKSLAFVSSADIENFSQQGITPALQEAIDEHKGVGLLRKLSWLTEANLLQQSVAYGDYTADLVESVLYDKSTKSLNIDPRTRASAGDQSIAKAAIDAMRTNPTLARNVILIAMRHAIADSLGGADKADSMNYGPTYYAMALADFSTEPCDGATLPQQKLNILFPNWNFEYRATKDQQNDPSYAQCPLEFTPSPADAVQLSARGSGVSVSIMDPISNQNFYVLAPSVVALTGGIFELPDTLRQALLYRDKLSQALIDRSMSDLLNTLPGDGKGSQGSGTTNYHLLNEAWNWQIATKSP